MKLMNTLMASAAVTLAFSLAGPAFAQDCERGTLDRVIVKSGV